MNFVKQVGKSFNDFFQKIQADKTDVNIILLGETGVGKSTFINSFANYITYSSLAKVKKSNLVCLIPTRFSISDKDYNEQVVELGCDNNEDQELGNSSTQGPRAYTFDHKDGFKIRLIDTPGIGDFRGLDQDRTNFENVLTYIGQFEYLHAICIFLKPNESVMNAYFKFCIVHLLSRLEKSASANICFLFTNSRSTFFKPGDTLPVLRKVLDEIKNNPPYVEIPCSKANMFCFDNEGFKYLVASKQGIKFGLSERETYSNSFYVSVETCKDLLKYISGDSINKGLTPHIIQKTLSVNEARRVIIDLSKPLADIADLIDDNLTVLKRHENLISNENITIADLQKKLYLPAIDIKQTDLTQPVTVCTASGCSEIYTISGISKYHYKQRCHNPCYLDDVPLRIIGAPQLQGCAAIDGDKCTECNCHFTTHMHLMYETMLVDVKLEDDTVKVAIETKEDMINQQRIMIKKLQIRKNEYEYEKKVITSVLALFAHFLEKSAIILYNDSYIDYINYLIEREEGLGVHRDLNIIHRYNELKKLYKEEKNILKMALEKAKETDANATVLNPQDIFDKVQTLYSLKNTGKKIKELHKKQEQQRKAELSYSMEYHYPNLKISNYCEEIIYNGNKKELIKKLLAEKDMEEIEMKITLLDLSSHFNKQQEIDDFKKDLFLNVKALYNKDNPNQCNQIPTVKVKTFQN